MDRLLTNFLLRTGIGLLIALLTACNGSSSDSSATSSSNSNVAPPVYSGVTTTLGTRGTTSQSNPAVTSNADGAWKGYWRGEDYPNVKDLGLQFITLKSGQKLGVLVSVPADAQGDAVAGTFPAILTQTAYRADVGDLLGSILPFGATLVVGGADPVMIKRGYVSVTVDVLGSGVSDGEEELLGANEQAAYGEAIDWVVQQSWSNGKVGLAGTSYLSITALLAAEQRKSAVKAVFADAPLGDAWRGITGTGGMLNGLFFSVWLQLTQFTSVLNYPTMAKYPQFADQIAAAQQQHIAAIDDFFLPMINNTLAGNVGYGTDDGSFWSIRSPLEHAADINVPTFIIGGAADIFQRDEPLLFEQLKRNTTTKLLIMPGSHVGSILSAQLDLYLPPDYGAPSSVTLLLQWFDKYLKGIDTGAEKLPNVTQWVNGYGPNGLDRFASTTDWPHPQSAPQRFYLHGDMSLSLQPPAAGEATHTVAEPSTYDVSAGKSDNGMFLLFNVTAHDGSDCSISYVQWTLGFAGLLPQPCYGDDNTVEQTQQALKYETAPMTSDFYINGPIQADVWMSSTVSAAAVSVRVDDVYPDGTAVPLTNGLLSAAFRAVDESRSRFLKGQMIQPWHPFTAASMLPVTPGVVMKLPVEIFPAAALIRIGHKLRIAISASNQVQGAWSTPDVAKARGGVSRIYNDPDHPSSVVLPVVPASVLNL